MCDYMGMIGLEKGLGLADHIRTVYLPRYSHLCLVLVLSVAMLAVKVKSTDPFNVMLHELLTNMVNLTYGRKLFLCVPLR